MNKHPKKHVLQRNYCVLKPWTSFQIRLQTHLGGLVWLGKEKECFHFDLS